MNSFLLELFAAESIRWKFEHIILSPHCDDALIGCSRLLTTARGKITIAEIMSTPIGGACPDFDERMAETARLVKRVNGIRRKRYGASAAEVVVSVFPLLATPVDVIDRLHVRGDGTIFVIWTPDGTTETHPKHRFVAGIGDAMRQMENAKVEGLSVMYGNYSVAMRSPYIVELTEEEKKVKWELSRTYGTQDDYFYLHREALLFEGNILL